jgi:hypothetical protein
VAGARDRCFPGRSGAATSDDRPLAGGAQLLQHGVTGPANAIGHDQEGRDGGLVLSEQPSLRVGAGHRVGAGERGQRHDASFRPESAGRPGERTRSRAGFQPEQCVVSCPSRS